MSWFLIKNLTNDETQALTVVSGSAAILLTITPEESAAHSSKVASKILPQTRLQTSWSLTKVKIRFQSRYQNNMLAVNVSPNHWYLHWMFITGSLILTTYLETKPDNVSSFETSGNLQLCPCNRTRCVLSLKTMFSDPNPKLKFDKLNQRIGKFVITNICCGKWDC